LFELSLEHLAVVLVALLVGALIGLALGVVVYRRPRLRAWALNVCGLILTVPSLAMYALLLALLGSIGTLPVVVALALYSLLPIVRNTVTGLNGVDAAVVESALGVGMGRWRRLGASSYRWPGRWCSPACASRRCCWSGWPPSARSSAGQGWGS
jgi:osmoprotectant transport system permease protein